MKVVLLERIEKLGRMGDVVSVKDGFGRNYLLPQKKALRATEENIAYFEKERAKLESESKDLEIKATGIAKKVEKVSLLLIRQASEMGNLYGSVSVRDIAKAFLDKEIKVPHTQIRIDSPIKTVGVHVVKIALHPEVTTFVKISVAQSEEEAKALLEDFEKPQEKTENKSQPKEEESMDSLPQETNS